MKRTGLGILIFVLFGLAALRAEARESTYPPRGDYLLFWQAEEGPAPCPSQPQANRGGEADAGQACAPSPQAAPFYGRREDSASPAVAYTPPACRALGGDPPPPQVRPPQRLWDLLLELERAGQARILDVQAGQGAVRLLAGAEAAARLERHPQTGRLQLLHAMPAFPGERAAEPATRPEGTPGSGDRPPAPRPGESPLTIGGTVREHDGSPVPGVYVYASGPVYSSAWTDATGQYLLEVLVGTYTVQVQQYSNELDPPPQTVSVPPSQSGIDFTFPERFTISGTVRDYDGTPLSGVRVNTSWGDPIWATDDTGADGAYSLEVVAGDYTVEAGASNYPEAPAQEVTVPPSQAGVDFSFPQSYAVSGAVRDFDGSPLPYLLVNSDPLYIYATTGANGEYVLHLPAGLHCLRVLSGELPAPAPAAVLVPPAQSGVDFDLPPRYTIGGVVRDYDGTPLPDVRVSTAWDGAFYASDYTAADGTYSLEVPAGTYRVVAEKDGRAGSPAATVSVPPDGPGTDLTFPQAYSISGTVRNTAGAPAPGASVDLCPAEGGTCVVTWTAGDGTYELLAPAGTWQVGVWIWPQTMNSPPDQTVTVPPARTDVDFTFTAAGPYTISGAVRDALGNPTAYARVTAGTTEDCWDDEYDYTRDDGTYTITVGVAGIYLVQAGPARRLVTVPPDATGADLAGPPLYSIAGTVRDAGGQPLAGARVETTVAGEKVVADTGAAGAYELRVPAGTYALLASHEGYASAPPQTVSVPPDRAGLDFSLPTGYRIQGVVRDDGGQAVSGAEVRAEGPSGSALAWSWSCGVYELLVAAGTYTVSAGLSGYASPAPQTVAVPPERFDVDLTLAPLDRYTIAGTVRDHDGSPLEGVVVSASGDNGYDSTYSGAAGTYQLSVHAGTYQVGAYRKGGYPSVPDQTVAVPPDRAGVDFTFPAQYTVQGTVRDGLGRPLLDAAVRAVGAVCGEWGDSERTGAGGAYNLTLPAGTYDLDAGLDDYAAMATRRLTLPPAAAGVDFTVALPLRYQVGGVVRDGGGLPLAGVQVRASACGTPGDSTTTAPDGSYTLLLAAATYTLETGSSGYADQQRAVAVSGDTPGVDFDLAAACCTVYGYVTGAEGLPLSDAYVEVIDGPDRDSSSTYDCGRYWLNLLQPGTYTLQAGRAGYYTSGPRTFTLPPGRGDVDFRLEALPGGESTVSGTVRDGAGQPLAGVEVELSDDHFWDWDTTDAQGQYAFAALPGSYEVRASATCYTDEPRVQVTVPPDATTDLTLLHRKTNRITGRVTDAEGQPLYGASVRAANDGYGYADSNGRYVLRLSPGAWTLSASGPYGCSHASPPDRPVHLPPDQGGVDFQMGALRENLYLPLVVKDAP